MRCLVLSLFIFVLCAGAASAAASDASDASGKKLTLERIWDDPPLTGRAPSGIHWLPNSKGISYFETVGPDTLEKTLFVIKSVPSGKITTICIVDTIAVPEDLRAGDDDEFSIGSYAWADEGDLMLFRFKNDIFTFDRSNGQVVRRTKTDEEEESVAFSPDGSRIAFTRENDIYIIEEATNNETRLTTTGCDTILNGVLDYVYMEEMFTRGNVKAYWWSPDSRKIAYLQFHEGRVPEFAIVDFMSTYNEAQLLRYSKAGDPNALVRVAVYDLDTGETAWMDVDTSDDSYIARVYWRGGSETLAIEKLNREQTELRLLFADAASGKVREAFAESRPTWVNVTYMKHYHEEKPRFVWASERDGQRHLYLYKNDGTLVRALTEGPWSVTSLDDVNEKRGYIYFTALEKSPLERHVYYVSERGGEIKRLTERAGTHSATFSPDHKYFIDRFSNVTTPTEISVRTAHGKEVFVLHKGGSEELFGYKLPVPEFLTVTAKDGLEFSCSMLKPVDFDLKRKYPVIVYVYGGPHAQVVRNRWGGNMYLWECVMTQKGYLVFRLDNRGSWGKGMAWVETVLRKLGQLELEDQLSGVEYLKSLRYVDAERIGIWGWSYGGYMTCLAMFKAPGVFKAGAAVAPLADWRYYDTIYTERFMKRPDDNEDGYREGAPIHFVDGLEGAFLLIHGTADDNVHMQNTMKLASALINEGKDFDLMLYPAKDHSIRGNVARKHLFTRLARFFEENL